ncbi:fumarylacetoacetate hydrolase family protein [Oceaniovalibus sp. ACAM 378]|uniref:fumarylacetoacetate hydrolase family protein n=1 Tax=Oceaniovalibus sp. ACAM 378 TaxID=2599923 RepID=UPI0011D73B48|nr:fumarylacetoacetate hydrolase family protein [Oceaniovalibus sp. ACAM 378]TYB88033.1 fumarylacetoacetate hydrolase family protein [Oceaniovalibus sp. ACAM 378]
MRFVRFGPTGAERPGVLDHEGRIRDLSGDFRDLSGADLARLGAVDPHKLPLVEGSQRLGVPVAAVGKYICIGMNYTDHARENGMFPPREPIFFLKATSALCGPNDPVILPRGSVKADFEAELGVVIGREAKYVTEDAALSHVAGYVAVNDLSDREFQIERAGQWTKGKSADTFGPVGPWLVTPDEAGDPQDMVLRLHLNGVAMQDGHTANMIFPVKRLISYVSQFMSLQPGDIIATGSPAGVGMGRRPPVWLKPGDEMELEVGRLGTQRQTVQRYQGFD